MNAQQRRALLGSLTGHLLAESPQQEKAIQDLYASLSRSHLPDNISLLKGSSFNFIGIPLCRKGGACNWKSSLSEYPYLFGSRRRLGGNHDGSSRRRIGLLGGDVYGGRTGNDQSRAPGDPKSVLMPKRLSLGGGRRGC